MALSLTVTASIVGNLTGDNDIAVVTAALAKTKARVFKTGAGANQANLAFSDTRTLAASAVENLDLAGGLVDVFGVALNFAKVKAIMVVAADANTNDVVIGGAASSPFYGPFGGPTHKLNVAPGGQIQLVAPGLAGWPVAAGTGDILKIANGGSDSPVTYDIIIVGV